MALLAPRMSRIKQSASQAASVRARALRAEGRDIIALTAGEPDFPTPDFAIEGAFAAARAGETKYTDPGGAPSLKKAIQAKLSRENGLDYALDEIIVGNGAKQVVFDAFMATLAPGDEVIVPAPYWASYPELALLAEGTPVYVACPQNNGFKLRPEDLEAAITARTRWLVLNHPNNPTGATYTADELRAIADVLLRHPDVLLMSDEIYEHLRFDGAPFASAVAAEPRLRGQTLTVNGVSKTYAMTGWRIGYAAGPAPLIKGLTLIQGHSTSSASAVTQAAAKAALEGPQEIVAERAQVMQHKRDLIVRMLNRCEGLSCETPGGAMYVFVSCAGVIGKRAPDG